MTMDATRTVPFTSCTLHSFHHPMPLIAQKHHTFPKELQARKLSLSIVQLERDPRFDATTAEVCGTGHDSIHELIRRMLRGETVAQRTKESHLATYAVRRFQEPV